MAVKTCKGVNVLEEWRSVVGYEGYYEVSNLGNVRSLDRIIHTGQHIPGKALKKTPSGNGYFRFNISRNGKPTLLVIHVEVAKAFIPNPENKAQVNHINSIRTDNQVSNLEWSTLQENLEHARLKGRHCHGISHGMSILTDEQAKEIYDLAIAGNLGQKEIASRYGVKFYTVSKIKTKRQWRHIHE